MDEDDGPQFDNAWAHSQPPTPNPSSWNPALRPDADDSPAKTASEKLANLTGHDPTHPHVPQDEDDDFFSRYPQQTPEQHRLRKLQTESAPAMEEPELESPTRAIAVQRDVEVRREQAPVQEMEDVPETVAEASGPASGLDRDGEDAQLETQEEGHHGEMPPEAPVQESETQEAAHHSGAHREASVEESEPQSEEPVPAEEPAQDPEAAVFGPDDTAEEQRVEIEEAPPADETVTEPTADAQQSASAVSHTAEQEHEPTYEFQGRTNTLDEAANEDAGASLLADEEPAPTPGWGDSKHYNELGYDGQIAAQQEPSAGAPRQQMDRSFTTNFTEPAPTQTDAPQHTDVQQETGWAKEDADQTFGELLDELSAVPVQEQQDLHGEASWPVQDMDGGFGELLDGRQTEVAREVRSEYAAPDGAEGGVAFASRATAVSQVLQEMSGPDSAPAQESVEAAAAEDDPWAAALDDDELLDEDAFGFDDDGEGFLEDTPPESLSPEMKPVYNSQGQMAGFSTGSQQQRRAPNQPSQQFLTGDSHSRSGATPSSDLYGMWGSSPLPQQQQQQRPAAVQREQSFVDKSKGGYSSPYDLPTDIVPVKARKRPSALPSQSTNQAPLPPPRSSSFNQSAPNSALSPPSSAGLGGAKPAPKTAPKNNVAMFEELPMIQRPSRSRHSGAYTPGVGPSPAVSTPPMGQPGRGPNGSGTYFPPSGPAMANPALSQQLSSRGPSAPPVQPHAPPTHAAAAPPPRPSAPNAPTQPGMIAGLRQPERLPLLPDSTPPSQPPMALPTLPTNSRYSPAAPSSAPIPQQNRFSPMPTPPTATTSNNARYSPAPPNATGAQQPRNRYVSAPGGVPPPAPHGPPAGNSNKALPFAPRTSSPLAFAGPPEVARSASYEASVPSEVTRRQSVEENRQQHSHQQMARQPQANNINTAIPPTAVRYSPVESRQPSQDLVPPPGPPRRPRTQSPGAVMKQPRAAHQPITRPRSGSDAPQQQQQQQQATSGMTKAPVLAHRRQFSRELSFAVPSDDRAADPLERWKGHPIMHFSPSGFVSTSFPRQTPFYAAGQSVPALKCTAGNVTLMAAESVLPADDRYAKFPGPLSGKGKGKKKELLAWMAGKVEDLERELESAQLNFSMPADEKKRAEEKLVLWKIMRLLVENDGMLEGKPGINEEVRRILMPNLAQVQQGMDLQSPMSAAPSQGEAVDKRVLEDLRLALLLGQREKAVFLAEEKKLWGHAMLIASTMGPEAWKGIIQSFVRASVRSDKSLAALYQVFAGAAEDSVDELVPPSARAGFQMISTGTGAAATNPLQGLDDWRETLCLIVSNRSPQDAQSLVALGRLLTGYGRVEAGHTCFLFARQMLKVSGPDDVHAHVTVFGARAEDSGKDLDSVLLTEVYEYAFALSAPSGTPTTLPHLQAYKLLHAQDLAARGLRTKSQTYCDSIMSAVKSSTRPSPYYHPAFLSAVDDLSRNLSQTPQTHGASSTWMPKLSSEKVSGSMGKWFSNFVAGEEDRDSSVSGPGSGAEGADGLTPFANVNGDVPATISRTPSSSDLYSGYPPSGALIQPGPPAAGKYAPGVGGGAGRSAPHAASSQYAPGRASLDSNPSDRPSTSGSGYLQPVDMSLRPANARLASYAPGAQYAPQMPGLAAPSRPEASRAASDYQVQYDSRRGSAQDSASNAGSSYEPQQPAQAVGFSELSNAEAPSYSYQPQVNPWTDSNSYAPSDASYELSTNGQVDASPLPPEPDAESHEYGAQVSGEQPSGYAPPSQSSGYEPPSSGYQPYNPSDEPDSPIQTRRKPMLDDDDDAELERRAAALKKAAADREADEAFKKAAEADAARDSQKGGDGKKGWFSGWLGKKDPNAAPAPSGPIRAKLGEQSSFYFDKDLNKWVNKKGGGEETAPSAASTPPPPRGGPPSRVASAMRTDLPPSRTTNAGPPVGAPLANGSSGPPSRAATPASGEGESGVASRPTTGMSTASSLDDLISAGPRKGGTVRGKKKGGRYVDVMAK